MLQSSMGMSQTGKQNQLRGASTLHLGVCSSSVNLLTCMGRHHPNGTSSHQFPNSLPCK